MSKHASDTFRPPNWSERLALWFIDLMPSWLVDDPERALLNAVMVLIGAFATVSQPKSSLVAYWDHWWAIEWGVGLCVGGILALVGMIRKKISVARFGIFLIMICALIYGVDVIWTFGARGAFAGITYIGIAVAKSIRLAKTTAERATILAEREKDHDGET